MKIIYLSSYPPRQCGIATFTDWLIKAVQKRYPKIEQKIIAINETGVKKRRYAKNVIYQLEQQNQSTYLKAAHFINKSRADILCLQHEFGLYGNKDGTMLIDLLKNVKIPIITFLHTIPILPTAKRQQSRLKIIKKIADYSYCLVITSKHGIDILKKIKINREKIKLLYHGAFKFPLKKISQKKLKEKIIILSYGLITKTKGLDYAIDAMTKIVKIYPSVQYLIIGEPHPVAARKKEKGYYQKLLAKVQEKKLGKKIRFINHYLTEKEIINYLKKAHIVLLPYLTKEQISSGILANAMAAGCSVITTPFIYSQDMIGKDGQRGFFIKFANANSIENKIISLIKKPAKIKRVSQRAYQFGRQFTWDKTAQKFISFLSRI
jgi:glycosyltransferase involved in cell wall biosynthesis